MKLTNKEKKRLNKIEIDALKPFVRVGNKAQKRINQLKKLK